jgi:hypothetical protein
MAVAHQVVDHVLRVEMVNLAAGVVPVMDRVVEVARDIRTLQISRMHRLNPGMACWNCIPTATDF